VKNGHDVPVFIDRIEATAGRRWELMAFSWREILSLEKEGDSLFSHVKEKNPPKPGTDRALLHSGLLLPGQELTFVLPYRVIAAMDMLIITVTPTSITDLVGEVYLPVTGGQWNLASKAGFSGFGSRKHATLDTPVTRYDRAVLRLKPVAQDEPILAGAEVSLPAPIAPFDPKWSRDVRHRPEAWGFSPQLGGYIIRVRAGSYNLQRENEVIPLPPTPFEFFEAIDGPEGKTRLLRHSGDVVVVTAANAGEILQSVLRAGRQVSFADDPEKAMFEERPW